MDAFETVRGARFCGFLGLPAKIFSSLRKSAVFCGFLAPPKLICFPGEPMEPSRTKNTMESNFNMGSKFATPVAKHYHRGQHDYKTTLYKEHVLAQFIAKNDKTTTSLSIFLGLFSCKNWDTSGSSIANKIFWWNYLCINYKDFKCKSSSLHFVKECRRFLAKIGQKWLKFAKNRLKLAKNRLKGQGFRFTIKARRIYTLQRLFKRKCSKELFCNSFGQDGAESAQRACFAKG